MCFLFTLWQNVSVRLNLRHYSAINIHILSITISSFVTFSNPKRILICHKVMSEGIVPLLFYNCLPLHITSHTNHKKITFHNNIKSSANDHNQRSIYVLQQSMTPLKIVEFLLHYEENIENYKIKQ